MVPGPRGRGTHVTQRNLHTNPPPPSSDFPDFFFEVERRGGGACAQPKVAKVAKVDCGHPTGRRAAEWG